MWPIAIDMHLAVAEGLSNRTGSIAIDVHPDWTTLEGRASSAIRRAHSTGEGVTSKGDDAAQNRRNAAIEHLVLQLQRVKERLKSDHVFRESVAQLQRRVVAVRVGQKGRQAGVRFMTPFQSLALETNVETVSGDERHLVHERLGARIWIIELNHFELLAAV